MPRAALNGDRVFGVVHRGTAYCVLHRNTARRGWFLGCAINGLLRYTFRFAWQTSPMRGSWRTRSRAL
jgi:hypothetical protein